VITFCYTQVSYVAIVSYSVNGKPTTYVDKKEITTTSTSYVFKLLYPSTKYTFTVTSYKGSSTKSSTKNMDKTTASGIKGNCVCVCVCVHVVCVFDVQCTYLYGIYLLHTLANQPQHNYGAMIAS